MKMIKQLGKIQLRQILPKWTALLSGVLWPLPYLGILPAETIFLALVPWLVELRNGRCVRFALLQTFWVVFIADLISFHWSIDAFQKVYQLPWVFCALAGLGFFAFNQLPLYAFAIIRTRFAPRRPSFGNLLLYILGAAAFFAALEIAVPKIFGDTLGHALYSQKYLRQAADLGGVRFLTFFIMITNLFLAETFFLLINKRSRTKALATFVTASSFVAFLYSYGFWRTEQILKFIDQSTTHIKVGVVQPNIPVEIKLRALSFHNPTQLKVTNDYLSLSRDLAEQNRDLDFIVWPETAYPNIYGKLSSPMAIELDSKLRNFTTQYQIPLVFGGFDVDLKTDQQFNSMFKLTPRLPVQIYHKTVLVPFGEYIPFLTNWGVKTGPRFTAGDKVQLLEFNTKNRTISAGPIICYEAIFTEHAVSLAQSGAHFLLNITDDSYFDSRIEAKLHIEASAFASIETRLPQLRATNSGISAYIDPLGELKNPTEPMSRTTIVYDLPIPKLGKPLVVVWKYWFLTVSAILTMLFFLVSKPVF